MDLSSDRRGPRSEINITPLVDVVLVLLIIFMCLTPVVQLGHSVQVPPSRKEVAPPPTSQLILRLDRNGVIYLNSTEIPRLQLAERLGEALSGRSVPVVFVAADGELEYGRVADFLDLCRASGVSDIGIVFEDLAAPTPSEAQSAS